MANEELVQKRKDMLAGAYSYTIYQKSNKNPKNERYCAICGRKLVERINLAEPYYYTLCKHYYLNVLNVFRISMCYDIRSCRSTLQKKNKLK